MTAVAATDHTVRVSSEGAPTVELRGVDTTLGGKLVMDGVDLRVESGEFFSILGPSGCGKTSTLKVLGGFLRPDSGTVHLEGRDVTGVPPYHRNLNTVFQSYALFGHLDVAGNVAFGLKRQRVGKSEIRRRVGEALDLVDLAGRAASRPAELSGGQRQRVALARALVNLPAVLLLDEPLGALDLKLRRSMQGELKRIQREVGVTFVYVTHDQEEALTMSDRIAVMDGGRIQQTATPQTLYDRPATSFVASFLGTSNLFPVQVVDSCAVLAHGTRVPLPPSRPGADPIRGSAILSVRPEKVLLGGSATEAVQFVAEVVDSSYLGSASHYRLRTPDGLELTAVVANAGGTSGVLLRPGERVRTGWSPEDSVLLAS